MTPLVQFSAYFMDVFLKSKGIPKLRLCICAVFNIIYIWFFYVLTSTGVGVRYSNHPHIYIGLYTMYLMPSIFVCSSPCRWSNLELLLLSSVRNTSFTAWPVEKVLSTQPWRPRGRATFSGVSWSTSRSWRQERPAYTTITLKCCEIWCATLLSV